MQPNTQRIYGALVQYFFNRHGKMHVTSGWTMSSSSRDLYRSYLPITSEYYPKLRREDSAVFRSSQSPAALQLGGRWRLFSFRPFYLFESRVLFAFGAPL
ncbi:hypothetical protein ACLOJK_013188 [Asimina triloba]